MWKLRSQRAKIPSLIVSSMYEKAMNEYREKFGEIVVPVTEDYSKEDWIGLFNECLRRGISVEKYIEQYGDVDGVPF